MTFTTPFSDIVVVECGRRTAVRACGSLLAEMGAKVFTASGPGTGASFSRFKTELAPAALAEQAGRANVILHSSDRDDDIVFLAPRPDQIVCDIVVDADPAVHGRGMWNDPQLQAQIGLADLTGTADSDPTICDAPIVEAQTALFAASGILAAWRHRTSTGRGLSFRISLLDCGLNNLSTFLPLLYGAKMPRRSGNRHPMAVPWNSYRARDGWVLLCSATDEHWARLCEVMGREDLRSGAFEKLADRVTACDAVDVAVEAWTGSLTVSECIARLGAAGLAAGPIATLEDLRDEPNLRHRRTVSREPGTMPLSFAKTAFSSGAVPVGHPAGAPALSEAEAEALPLRGIRVIEIGQYTTAPLAAKHLALLGAEVIKIEPPSGEASRAWPPHQDGQGYFFTMNNTNKQSCMLDLRIESDQVLFRRLLETADVLIENLKPGSLARLGFGPDVLAALNPGLVYCAISGFGQSSAYPGRPAFDTVIQAMSGLMDLTKVNGVPTKLGTSAADVTGGIAGLFCVLAGLEQRRRTGRGMAIDLAMQDVAVWLTQAVWNGSRPDPHVLVRCADGFVVADRSDPKIVGQATYSTREDILALCATDGIEAAAVRTLAEIGADTKVVGRGAVMMFRGHDGREWPLFRPVLRFADIPPVSLMPIGALGEFNARL
ncbi:CoA transferase [Xanthobacter wiegelii]|uniref:CoA transferase n=1 Tax=Xanthobacter wiegelii TaxID=3119913 RepID=UPI003726CC8F